MVQMGCRELAIFPNPTPEIRAQPRPALGMVVKHCRPEALRVRTLHEGIRKSGYLTWLHGTPTFQRSAEDKM